MHLIFLVMNWCSRCTSADSWSAGAGSPTCLFVLISPFLLTTIHEEQNKPITINMPSPGIRLATIDIEWLWLRMKIWDWTSGISALRHRAIIFIIILLEACAASMSTLSRRTSRTYINWSQSDYNTYIFLSVFSSRNFAINTIEPFRGTLGSTVNVQ